MIDTAQNNKQKGKGMWDAVIEAFGELTVATVIIFAVAAAALWRIYRKAKKYVIKQYKKKEERNKKIQECLDQIKLYPKWRQQSVAIQKEFTEAINGLKEVQEKNIERLEEIEAANRKRKRNELRERLLQSYHYYGSKDKNPMQAWSEMEADSFWKVFKDYEDLDGDGYAHSEIQPTMNNLEKIPMHETEKIRELMQSRR